ncbi:MAG: GNAT family protein [Chloroflexota bacterium]
MITSNLLRGEKVRLTAIENRDIPTMAHWWEDMEFLRNYDTLPAFPKSEDQISRIISDEQASHNGYLFGIRPVDEETIVGLLELSGIQWSHRTAYIGIGIGNGDYRNRGLGRDAMNLGLRFAFQELNLHRVWLTVIGYNARAVTLYEQLGFVREGAYRDHVERDGTRYDMLVYGLLRQEWLDTAI